MFGDGLFFKLLRAGVKGKVCEVLRNMYSIVRSVIQQGGGCEAQEVIEQLVGVRQGCILSPCLFSLFISDLPDALERGGACGVELRDLVVRILMYADDGALVAESAGDLQLMLDILREYCSKWRLLVNDDKTEAMIFHRRGRKEKYVGVFKYGVEAIRVVESFKYLGLVFHESGRYKEMVEHRLLQGKRVLAAWLRRVKVWILNGFVAERLFKSCVLPALEYGVCIWGSGNYYGSTVWQKVERFWRYAARTILGVSSQAPNAAVLGELGWLPFKGRAAVQALKMWTRGLQEGRENALVFRAMLVQRDILQGVYKSANRPKALCGGVCWLSLFQTEVCKSSFGGRVWDAWWNGCDIKGIWRRVVSSRDVVDTESACAPAMVPRKVVHELSLYQELEIELYSELVREWKTDINDVNMKGDMLEDDVNDNVINLTDLDTLLDVNVREVHVG